MAFRRITDRANRRLVEPHCDVPIEATGGGVHDAARRIARTRQLPRTLKGSEDGRLKVRSSKNRHCSPGKFRGAWQLDTCG
jgi:hypothetical protein